jgi:hypothetical protein
VTNSYSKSLGTLSRFTVPLRGAMYVGKMLGIIFTVAKSFPSFDRLSEGSRDGPARAVEGEAGSAPEDDACTPVDNPHSDMTLSALRLASTSLTDSSVALNSSDIYAQDQ